MSSRPNVSKKTTLGHDMTFLKTLKTLGISAAAVLATMGSAQAQDESGDVQYPVILAHGFNSDSSSFFAIPTALNQVGVDIVFKTDVNGIGSSYARGEELITQIENVLAVTGHDKVNLIGHSQGGLDARYVAAVRPDLVASITAVASPNYGVNVADDIDNNTGPFTGILGGFVDGLLNLFGNNQAQAIGALNTLTSSGAAEFNGYIPAALRNGNCRTAPTSVSFFPFSITKDYSVNDGDAVVGGVNYYSMAGTSSLLNYNPADPIDYALAATNLSFDFGEDNDGLIGRCSTHLGKVIRDDYTMNHNDFTNSTNGLRGLGTNDPLAVYKSHARRLKDAGL